LFIGSSLSLAADNTIKSNGQAQDMTQTCVAHNKAALRDSLLAEKSYPETAHAWPLIDALLCLPRTKSSRYLISESLLPKIDLKTFNTGEKDHKKNS